MLAKILVLLALAMPALAIEETDRVPDHAGLKTEIVGITPGRLIPTVKQVSSTDAFGWINYASRNASIAFEAETAKQMMCTGPSPFRVDGDKLVASPVVGGGFATLCELAPGEYDYEVKLTGNDTPLLGKLVVVAQ